MNRQPPILRQPPRDFRTLLEDELVQRCEKNPRYSLRSFAQTLQIGSSDLSKLIKRKRALTEPTLLKLGKRLNLNPEWIEYYRDELKTKKVRREGSRQNKFYQEVNLDQFRLVSNWYHMAILELMKLEDFEPDPKWIESKLGISVNEVNAALQRLQRLGYLESLPDGKWRDLVGPTTSVDDEYSDLARRTHQKKILELAATALDEVPIEHRDQSAMLMAIRSSRISQAKELIKKFRRDLCEFLEDGDKHDDVYFLSVSLFPVTKTKRKPNPRGSK